MNYEEAIETKVSRKQAEREIKRHGLDPNDFFAEFGSREQYNGSDILGWLGY